MRTSRPRVEASGDSQSYMGMSRMKAERDREPGRGKGSGVPLADQPSCICCGHPVPERPLGCKWPCPNCGYLYPRGDCSD